MSGTGETNHFCTARVLTFGFVVVVAAVVVAAAAGAAVCLCFHHGVTNRRQQKTKTSRVRRRYVALTGEQCLYVVIYFAVQYYDRYLPALQFGLGICLMPYPQPVNCFCFLII